MAITINGTGTITGISAGGLPDGSVTAADIESSLDLTGKTVTLPSGTGGKVLQVQSQYTYRSSSDILSITNTAGGQSALYGLISGRVYATVNTVSITPISSSSTLVLMGTIGKSFSTTSNKGAEGAVFVKDNTTGYEFSDYPGYDGTHLRPNYGMNYTTILTVSSGNTNEQSWTHKAFSYNEGSPSSSNVHKVASTSLVIMEIA